MNTQKAYDIWSDTYDTNINKTRDLEGKAIKQMLAEISFKRCVEIGCGTGKNTKWLCTQADLVTSVDLSESMLLKAKEKIKSDRVGFHQADIIHSWDFINSTVDLITFSLVLEHIENLDEVFRKASASLVVGGYVYLGELHPFKQYSGSKARFETENGVQVVPCFNHNVSDFVLAANKNGLTIIGLNEYFDEDDRATIPRILTLLLRKIDG